jgi:hypothetical protein
LPITYTTKDYVRHECGHIVVGKVLGFVTGSIVIEDNMAGAGTDQYFSCPTIETVNDHVMRRVQVLYAGAIAQTLQGRKIDPNACHVLFDGPASYNTAAHDFAKIKELLRLWIAIRYPGATNERFEKQLAKAVRVLSDSAAKIVIREALLIHGITDAVMKAYTPWSRTHKNQKFEFTQAQIDSLPEVMQRFSDQNPTP